MDELYQKILDDFRRSFCVDDACDRLGADPARIALLRTVCDRPSDIRPYALLLDAVFGESALGELRDRVRRMQDQIASCRAILYRQQPYVIGVDFKGFYSWLDRLLNEMHPGVVRAFCADRAGYLLALSRRSQPWPWETEFGSWFCWHLDGALHEAMMLLEELPEWVAHAREAHLKSLSLEKAVETLF